MADQVKHVAIPIVDAQSSRVVGGFCASLDAVTEAELAALQRLRELRAAADTVKARLSAVSDPTERAVLRQQLVALRQEAGQWREAREQATREKHIALGHASPPIQTPHDSCDP
ncbi:MAG: hypothetical protein HQL66_13760 [Magnetococcales bacterium]|nr:hypothetical protein [Magnetococcales bacterium]